MYTSVKVSTIQALCNGKKHFSAFKGSFKVETENIVCECVLVCVRAYVCMYVCILWCLFTCNRYFGVLFIVTI